MSAHFAGLPALNDSAWSRSWSAIKAVWASKWNERAVSSMRKAGLEHGELQMAVLCQPVIPAQFAFVVHTRHPTLGEVLGVGSKPGPPPWSH